jgi:hypothetical protein
MCLKKGEKKTYKYIAGIISELMARKKHSQGTRRGDTRGKRRMKEENAKLQENIEEGYINLIRKFMFLINLAVT